MENAMRVKTPKRKARPEEKAGGAAARMKAATRPSGRMSAEIDPDERIWRPLGEGRSGVAPHTHARMQALAHELWLTNLMGQRLIEIVTDHVVGEGVNWYGEDDRAVRVVKAFWGDPVNQMDIRFERLVSELGIFGELLLPVAVSRFEGRVRLGYVSPPVDRRGGDGPGQLRLAYRGRPARPGAGRGGAQGQENKYGSGWRPARLFERIRPEGTRALHGRGGVFVPDQQGERRRARGIGSARRHRLDRHV